MRSLSWWKVLALGGAVVAVGTIVTVLLAAGGEDAPPERGTIIVGVETEPAGQAGTFSFTGVPTGTVSADATLVVADLEPGVYATTEVDPAPAFDVTAIRCDDDESATPSSGDSQTRTAVFSVDPGETVRCIFTQTQRGSVVLETRTDPAGSAGSFQFTGVPSGTVPQGGTLVVTGLRPGTYTSTQVDPTPEFTVGSVDCDDSDGGTPSSGDRQTRTVVFNVDPGELVTCTFTNTASGTIVVDVVTEPGDAEGSFQFTGVPTGTIPSGGTLVISNLQPGTYTTTQVDPAPDLEVTGVECDDGAGTTPSAGDAATRTAVINVDPGETIRCTFTNTAPDSVDDDGIAGGSGGGFVLDPALTDGENPFERSDDLMPLFPEPVDLPEAAGTYPIPKAGPWSATNGTGRIDCGATALTISALPPESGVIEVLDGGLTLVGTGFEAGTVPITMTADPAITGRYRGQFSSVEQGVPITIDSYWQVVTDEYVVGFLTSTFSSEGVTCSLYRPFELAFVG